jgi:predicted DNA-binding ribbon-helix-helix protein
MKSRVVKHSIVIDGRKTSISLEDTFWKALREIAQGRNIRLSELVALINAERKHDNLSSAIRLFILDFYSMRRDQETTAGKASQLDTVS